jgi:hypothetical protein
MGRVVREPAGSEVSNAGKARDSAGVHLAHSLASSTPVHTHRHQERPKTFLSCRFSGGKRVTPLEPKMNRNKQIGTYPLLSIANCPPEGQKQNREVAVI